MHVITYKGKPATLEKLYYVGLDDSPGLNLGGHIDKGEREGFIAAGSAAACKRLYANWFGGYTWAERFRGVEVKEICGGWLE